MTVYTNGKSSDSSAVHYKCRLVFGVWQRMNSTLGPTPECLSLEADHRKGLNEFDFGLYIVQVVPVESNREESITTREI